MGDGVPFAEWTGELLYHARLSWRNGAKAKASLNRAAVAGIRHETKWANHGQVEAGLNARGGPNPLMLQN